MSAIAVSVALLLGVQKLRGAAREGFASTVSGVDLVVGARSGPVNLLLRVGGENGLTVFGRMPPQWLTDPNDARAAIIVMSLFTIGEGFVLLLAARQGLPGELYELASVEDATDALNREVFADPGLSEDDATDLVAIVARMRKNAGDFADPRPQPEPLSP